MGPSDYGSMSPDARGPWARPFGGPASGPAGGLGASDTASDAADVAASAGKAGLKAAQTASTVAGVVGAGGAAAGAASAAGATATAASATAATAGGSGIVGAAASAAGVSASVPVVGWIVAGGIAAAAGTIALVKALHSAKIRKADAVAEAKKLGLPDASKVPAFTVRALRLAKKDPSRLVKVGEKLTKQLHHKKSGIVGKLTHPGSLLRSKKKIIAKRALLGAIVLQGMAERRGHAPAQVDHVEIEQEHEEASSGGTTALVTRTLAAVRQPYVWIPLVGVLAILVIRSFQSPQE